MLYTICIDIRTGGQGRVVTVVKMGWRACLLTLFIAVDCGQGKQPNFVVVLTDDQDVLLGEEKVFIYIRRCCRFVVAE